MTGDQEVVPAALVPDAGRDLFIGRICLAAGHHQVARLKTVACLGQLANAHRSGDRHRTGRHVQIADERRPPDGHCPSDVVDVPTFCPQLAEKKQVVIPRQERQRCRHGGVAGSDGNAEPVQIAVAGDGETVGTRIQDRGVLPAIVKTGIRTPTVIVHVATYGVAQTLRPGCVAPPGARGVDRGCVLVVEGKTAIAGQRVASKGQAGTCPNGDAVQLAGGDGAVADANVGALQGEPRPGKLDGRVFQAAAAARSEGQSQPVAGQGGSVPLGAAKDHRLAGGPLRLEPALDQGLHPKVKEDLNPGAHHPGRTRRYSERSTRSTTFKDHKTVQITLWLPDLNPDGQGVAIHLDQVQLVPAALIDPQPIPRVVADGHPLVIVDAIAGQQVARRRRGQRDAPFLVKADEVARTGCLAADLVVVGEQLDPHPLLPVAQGHLTRPIAAHIVALDGVPRRRLTSDNDARAQVAADQVAGAGARIWVPHSADEAIPAPPYLYAMAQVGHGRHSRRIGADVVALDHAASGFAVLDTDADALIATDDIAPLRPVSTHNGTLGPSMDDHTVFAIGQG